jgi:hypothetical protein
MCNSLFVFVWMYNQVTVLSVWIAVLFLLHVAINCMLCTYVEFQFSRRYVGRVLFTRIKNSLVWYKLTKVSEEPTVFVGVEHNGCQFLRNVNFYQTTRCQYFSNYVHIFLNLVFLILSFSVCRAAFWGAAVLYFWSNLRLLYIHIHLYVKALLLLHFEPQVRSFKGDNYLVFITSSGQMQR